MSQGEPRRHARAAHGQGGSLAARGLFAGAVGVLAEAGWSHLEARRNRGRSPVYALPVMVHRMARTLSGRELDAHLATVVAGVARAGYGSGWGIVWAFATSNRRHRLGRDTMVLAGLVWVFELTVLPLVGATPHLPHWSLRDILGDLLQCMIFAAVTTGVLVVLDRVWGSGSRDAGSSTRRPTR